MAGSSLLALLDDITTLLDDVAAMTKVAATKTTGIAGDDLAVNAHQVTGIDPSREIPVVLAVAKGSLINKGILIPAALIISAVVPWLIKPLLMLGGAYLCFEGVEKVAHSLHKKQGEEHHHAIPANVDPVSFEKDKIKGAIRTDFILSAEIVVIALGTIADASFMQQVIVLCAIGVGMTVGVYGLVAGIVKMDDLGLHMSQRRNKYVQKLGRALLVLAPKFMKLLSVVGTLAMFIVGGGILIHGVTGLEALLHDAGFVLTQIANAAAGIVAGGIILAIVTGLKKYCRAS